ncbi:MAG: polysaccharide deacetylase family protein [Stellaceae bacterium]
MSGGTPNPQNGRVMDCRVPILMYHRIADDGPPELAPYRVSPVAFREQVRFLRDRGFYSISLTDWTFSIVTRRFLPGKPVIITFDDGYRDFFANAWPILKDADYRATIFVVTSKVGGVADWDVGASPAALMDWDELRTLQQSGNTIGSHCNVHRDLTRLSDEAIARDGAEARDILRRELGVEVTAVAFPWGASSPHVRRALAKSGYTAGLGVVPRVSSVSDEILNLPRIEIFGGDNLETFARRIAGEPPAPSAAPGAGQRNLGSEQEMSGGARESDAVREEHGSLAVLAARIDLMIAELASIKRSLVDRTMHPLPLERSLELLFVQPVTGSQPILLTPHQSISPSVRVGFEGTAQVEYSILPRRDGDIQPWSKSLRLVFIGPSRWLSLDLLLAWTDLDAVHRYHLGLSIAVSRTVACRAVLRLWHKDEEYKEIVLAAFTATPAERNYNLSGDITMPAPLVLDHDSDPIFLLLFDTIAELEIDICYLNLYFS